MTLRICNALLEMSPVGQRMRDVAQIPRIVRPLLEQLDEHVGDGHGETVIESDSSFPDGSAEGRHAGDVFGDGDDFVGEVVDELVGLRRGTNVSFSTQQLTIS